MTQRAVTEFDLRAPEFKHPSTKPEDLEFRDDGKIVRKDRWETGIHRIASATGFSRREGFEIDDVVSFIEGVTSALEDIDHSFILSVLERAAPRLAVDDPRMATGEEIQLAADIRDAIQIVQNTVLKLAEAAPPDATD